MPNTFFTFTQPDDVIGLSFVLFTALAYLWRLAGMQGGNGEKSTEEALNLQVKN